MLMLKSATMMSVMYRKKILVVYFLASFLHLLQVWSWCWFWSECMKMIWLLFGCLFVLVATWPVHWKRLFQNYQKLCFDSRPTQCNREIWHGFAKVCFVVINAAYRNCGKFLCWFRFDLKISLNTVIVHQFNLQAMPLTDSLMITGFAMQSL